MDKTTLSEMTLEELRELRAAWWTRAEERDIRGKAHAICSVFNLYPAERNGLKICTFPTRDVRIDWHGKTVYLFVWDDTGGQSFCAFHWPWVNELEKWYGEAAAERRRLREEAEEEERRGLIAELSPPEIGGEPCGLTT